MAASTTPKPRRSSKIAANDDEIVIAIPPTDSLEEFLQYPQAALVLTQYLLSQNKKDNDVLFWSTVRDYKQTAADLPLDQRRMLAARIFDNFLKADSPEHVTVSNQLLVDLVEARLWDPEPDSFDSVQADVLDRLERDVYPEFRKSKTYQAVVNDSVERLPFTPAKTTKVDGERVTRVPSVVAEKLSTPASGSQEALDQEIRKSKRMLRRFERHLRAAQGPLPPDELEAQVKKTATAAQ